MTSSSSAAVTPGWKPLRPPRGWATPAPVERQGDERAHDDVVEGADPREAERERHPEDQAEQGGGDGDQQGDGPGNRVGRQQSARR